MLFGIWWGLVAVPINARLHAREVSYPRQRRHQGLLHQQGYRDVVGSIAVERDFAVVSGRQPRLCSTEASDGTRPDRPGSRCAGWLFYTSGTTGRAQGRHAHHRNLMAMLLGYLGDITHRHHAIDDPSRRTAIASAPA